MVQFRPVGCYIIDLAGSFQEEWGHQRLGIHGEESGAAWGKMRWVWLTATPIYGQRGGKIVELEQKEVPFQIVSNTAKAGKPAMGNPLYAIQSEH